MRIPFIGAALERRRARRELIRCAHHDYFRLLSENEGLREELAATRKTALEVADRATEIQVYTLEVESAAKDLANALGAVGSSNDLAASLTCPEVDALARLLAAVGRPDLALKWLEDHANTQDEEEDGHVHGLDDEGKRVDLTAYLTNLTA
ncbi:hypothetical protein [Streptomyces luteireticuli]|uniref:hypothetical protein n=1 Tax=Streptomyces luteireticuli TaxID=173858 RepID=UPI0035580D8A